MLVELLDQRFSKIFLFVSEVFNKSFSFILFWFLGIKLSGIELNEFLLEMPFIFIFSTVLSFGASTFFLDQKKNNKDTFYKQLTFSLSFVVILNLLLVTVALICFALNFISLKYLLLFIVAVSLNLNTIMSEYFFVSKRYFRMILTSLIPKLIFYIGIIFLNEYYFINKNLVYLLIIFSHIIFSSQVIFNINFKMTVDQILKYFQFSWVITLQPILVYFSYVSFRYFIDISNDSNYLIEFSILQTFMGFFAFLISVANRFLIHDLYESLIINSVSEIIRKKFLVFNKLFFLVCFIYLNIVIYYSRYNLDIDISQMFFLGVFFMVIASLLNFISQFYKSMIVFDKKFKFLLIMNLCSSVTTIILTYLCSILNINILYSFSLVFVNFVVFVVFKSKIDSLFFDKLIPPKFIFKMVSLLSAIFIIEYFVYTNNFYILIINISFLLFIFLDLLNMILKNKLLILNPKL
jgi:hypothetical protein